MSLKYLKSKRVLLANPKKYMFAFKILCMCRFY